jgi:hypothetical protein
MHAGETRLRRNVIVSVVVVCLLGIGYVGYLLSRDPRQYYLSAGSAAVIHLSGDDRMILQDTSTEDRIPLLEDGDQIQIVDDSSSDSSPMRKVKVLVESGHKPGTHRNRGPDLGPAHLALAGSCRLLGILQPRNAGRPAASTGRRRGPIEPEESRASVAGRRGPGEADETGSARVPRGGRMRSG